MFAAGGGEGGHAEGDHRLAMKRRLSEHGHPAFCSQLVGSCLAGNRDPRLALPDRKHTYEMNNHVFTPAVGLMNLSQHPLNISSASTSIVPPKGQ